MKAHISEIYSAIQGEGEYLGVRQIFLRFCVCNLNCAYCDTIREAEYGRYEKHAGKRDFVKFKNPVGARRAVPLQKIIKSLNKTPHHSISLTGGEPLLHADFLAQFLPIIKKEKLKIFLETNGTLPGELNKIIKLIDIIAMDIKLPSVTKDKPFWKEHKSFIDAAIKNKKEIFMKLVVGRNTKLEEIKKASDLIKDKNIPVILQPVFGAKGPSLKQLTAWQIILLEKHKTVKVIPQVHKLMGEI